MTAETVAIEDDHFFFYPSQSDFSTIQSGLWNGMNLTHFQIDLKAPMHMFSPLLVSVHCLKIWIGL